MSTPENRPVSFFSLFRRGQHYAKTWPLDKRLAPVFIENRIIRATRYAIRIMPPVAVFTLCWQIALGGQLGACRQPVLTPARPLVICRALHKTSSVLMAVMA
jgi:uncharacterized membrane protein YfbV (UPF0208 family)